jgi:hypothetical protein
MRSKLVGLAISSSWGGRIIKQLLLLAEVLNLLIFLLAEGYAEYYCMCCSWLRSEVRRNLGSLLSYYSLPSLVARPSSSPAQPAGSLRSTKRSNSC